MSDDDGSKILPTPAYEIVDNLTVTLSKIAVLTEYADTLKAQLRATLPPARYVNVNGAPLVTISQSGRFNATRAAKFLTEAELASCMTTTLDPKKMKEKLTSDEIKEATDFDSKNRVIVKSGD